MPVGSSMLFLGCAAVFAGLLLLGRRGRDLIFFERLREASPSEFRSLVMVCRINGILVTAFCAVMLLITPVMARSPTGGWLLALACLVTFGVALIVAIRWTRWAWRTKL